MRNWLSRLAWNNLSLRLKMVLISGLQLGLISLIAAIAFTSFDNVRATSETAVAVIVETHNLAADIQRQVETLRQYQNQLNSEFDSTGYQLTELETPYTEEAAKLQENVNRLRDLLKAIGLPPNAVEIPVGDFRAGIERNQQKFIATLNVVKQLTDPASGALPLLEGYSNKIQDLTLTINYNQLTAQFVRSKKLEDQMIRTRGEIERASLQQGIDGYIVVYNSITPPDEQGATLDLLNAYSLQVNITATLLTQLSITHADAVAELDLLRDAASRLNNLVLSQANGPLNVIGRQAQGSAASLATAVTFVVLISLAVAFLFSRNVGRSVGNLLEAARRLEGGNLRVRVETRGRDEFARLGSSINAMATQIGSLIGGLEQRVADRARDLNITADIGRAVVTVRDPRELMSEIVELIRHRFNFYHTQVFLLDSDGANARLAASTGTAGRELLSRNHFLPVGSQSVIGQVTASGEPVIASDTDTSGIHRQNDLLPDTRSEMALPMRIGDRIIGALDIQSVAPNAFESDQVAVFQIMADQLAIALENARLFNQLEESQAALQAFERRVTRETWQTFRETRSPDSPLAYQFSEDTVKPQTVSTPPQLSESLETGRVITREGNGSGDYELAVPIKVRGEVIGAFSFGGELLQNLSEDDIGLVQAVVDRVGLALENIRLVQQTARRAEHEQVVNEITAKIVGSTDINYILQTTVKELGRVLNAPQTSVQLRREKADDND